MQGISLPQILAYIQATISFLGVVLILMGVLAAAYQFILHFLRHSKKNQNPDPFLNSIRLNLSRTLILGLEFIVAADLIATTTTPDYYSVGIVAAIVAIRTLLSFSLNKEIKELSIEEATYKTTHT